MSNSWTINLHPGLPQFGYAKIMSKGNAMVPTGASTSGRTGDPLTREERVETEYDIGPLPLVGPLGGRPVNVEQGLFRKRQPLSATVIAEGGAFWLVVMRATDWSAIWMMALRPLDGLDHPELALAMDRLSRLIEEEEDLDAVAWNLCRSSLVLVSGSLAFIGCLLPWLAAHGTWSALLFVEDVGWHPEPPVFEELTWLKISHQRVGGIITQVGLFGFFRLGGWTLDNKVGREIGHILDYR
jgi:hypothetical protein